MAETTNIPSGDLDTAAVEAAVSGAKGPERESMEEITIKFAKGLCGEPFMSKDGKELVRIQIPNADPNDHSPWQEFVLASKQVHENQYGSGLWAKIPAEGHTTVSRPFLAGQDENGRNVWEKRLRSVRNRELKEMVEFYKSRGRNERHPASQGRETQKKTETNRSDTGQKEEPDPAREKTQAGSRTSMKDQLEAGKKESSRSHSPKAKAAKKPNKEPEL